MLSLAYYAQEFCFPSTATSTEAHNVASNSQAILLQIFGTVGTLVFFSNDDSQYVTEEYYLIRIQCRNGTPKNSGNGKSQKKMFFTERAVKVFQSRRSQRGNKQYFNLGLTSKAWLFSLWSNETATNVQMIIAPIKDDERKRHFWKLMFVNMVVNLAPYNKYVRTHNWVLYRN